MKLLNYAWFAGAIAFCLVFLAVGCDLQSPSDADCDGPDQPDIIDLIGGCK